MHLWLVATAARLAPFGDAIGATFVFDGTLASHQEALCRSARVEVVAVGGGSMQVGPGLVLFDDTYVNDEALAYLVRAARAGGSHALCLGENALGSFLAPLARLPTAGTGGAQAVGLFATDTAVAAADADGLRRALAGASQAVVLPPGATSEQRLPGFPRRRPTLTIPRAAALACRIRHWVHALWLNQALAYAPRDRAEIDRRGNRVAPTARVHPTAYVERSWIGPGAVVEPHCALIDTLLGADCHVADHTVLIGCALGSGCQTLTDSHLCRVVSYPDSTLSSLGCEELLVGRRVFMTAATIFFLTTLGENAAVDDGGQLVDTGRPRLGGCVGHRSVLGTRAIFGPGLALPNDSLVVMRPEEGVARIDPAIADGRPACWHDGQLLPIERVARDYRPPEID
ncbi:MAG: hypothetical protein JXR83_12720 [Deltaproteobacteria bacterium]|nr:hypothetical protein [Deltaproteobacteria bacterium]